MFERFQFKTWKNLHKLVEFSLRNSSTKWRSLDKNSTFKENQSRIGMVWRSFWRIQISSHYTLIEKTYWEKCFRPIIITFRWSQQNCKNKEIGARKSSSFVKSTDLRIRIFWRIKDLWCSNHVKTCQKNLYLWRKRRNVSWITF